MKNKKQIILSALIVLFSVLIIIYSNEISESVINSINVCINVIIPSMFIFMVISTYILTSGLYRIIFKPLVYIFRKILRLDEISISVFLLSLIGGYPVGVKLLKETIAENKNYSAIADKMTAFCYCISPTFAVTMLGIGLYGSIEAGIIIYIANIISCFVSAIVYSRIFILKIPADITQNTKQGTIIDSISSSCSALFRICAIIVFFNSVITVSDCILNDFGVNFPNEVKSIFEISNIIKSKNISVNLLPYISSLASFGGLCVVFQCMAITEGAFSMKHFLLSRLLNIPLTFVVTKLLLYFWEISVPVSTFSKNFIFCFSPQKAAAVFLILMLIILMQKSEKIFKKG